MRSYLTLLLVLVMMGCKDISSEDSAASEDDVEVHKAPPPPGPRTIMTTEEDFYKEVQGRWEVTTDPSGTVEIRDRTISFDGSNEWMPFSVSWDPCNNDLEASLNERYAGQYALYLSMKASDGSMKCIAMLDKTTGQFTLSDEEGRSEATYRKVAP